MREYKNIITMHLPYPPSANHYRKRDSRRNRDYLTPEANAYCLLVACRVHQHVRIDTPCRQTIMVNPPDRIKRDLTNIEKVLNDALQKCGLLADDRLIYDHRIMWQIDKDGKPEVVKGGACEVTFEW